MTLTTTAVDNAVPRVATSAPVSRVARTRLIFWGLVALGCSAYVARGVLRLRDLSIWAEDGREFLAGAHNLGIESFAVPYAGYLHTLPRLVAFVLSPAPLVAAPALYAAAAIGIYLALIGQVLAPRMAWLIPSAVMRSATFALLCLLPHMDEVYGNICNLVTVAGVGLFLMVMSGDPQSQIGRIAEVPGAFVLSLGGAIGPFFAPFFFYRWWRNSRSVQSLCVAVSASVASMIQAAVFLNSTRSTSQSGLLRVFAKATIERVGGGWLYGRANVFLDTHHGWAQLNSAIWLLAAFIVTSLLLGKTAMVVWTLFAFVMAGVAVGYGSDLFLGTAVLQRQLVIPTVIILVLLMASLAVLDDHRRWARAVAVGCLAVGIGTVGAGFLVPGYEVIPDMDGLDECVKSGAAECKTPIAPTGWEITLQQ
ncbi:hypothetical protein [Rhodococcus opacus]|uniref:hypothetical protein n=1 Tax=Rhodococcus opacus TaxID=37919 RepID=UPI0024B98C07|nr:hypothetical protein [Rhodococcus opacus]MDJ0414394.1 hypothetical protein [Rhodococcus opacus]